MEKKLQKQERKIQILEDIQAIERLQDDFYDAVNGGEFIGRAHYDNKYEKIDDRWFCTEMALTYLRGESNIIKRYTDVANAYKVFMM